MGKISKFSLAQWKLVATHTQTKESLQLLRNKGHDEAPSPPFGHGNPATTLGNMGVP